MAALAAIGTVVSVVGTIASFAAAQAQADATQEAANYKAMMERRRANEERAAASRRAADRRQERDIAQSALQARAAASGGGASDPTIIKLGQGIETEGTYQALVERYIGEVRGQNLETQANLTEFEGRAKANALRAKGTIGLLSDIPGIAGNLSKFVPKYG